jgi:Zn-dependent protease
MGDFFKSAPFLIWISLAVGAIWLGRLNLAARVLRSLRWISPQRTPEPNEFVPLFLLERAAAESPRLEEMGFVSDGAVRLRAREMTPANSLWQWRHEEAGTLIYLTVESNWVESGAARWACITALTDGSLVETTNKPQELLLPFPPKCVRIVMDRRPLAELWESHLASVQAQVERVPALPVSLSAPDAEQRMTDFNQNQWSGWKSTRDVFVETRPGVLQLTWRWILFRGLKQILAASRVVRARAKVKDGKSIHLASPDAAFSYSDDAKVELDLQAFRTSDALVRARRLNPRGRLIVSLVTLVAFAVVLAWWGNWEFALILSAALLFHELGHLAAMRLFGSRDTSLLFIPMFGGAAVQNDRTLIKPWQEVIMLLAGPLPGIIIGLALAAYAIVVPGSPGIVVTSAATLLLLNAFNLLPVMPLDGGQLLNVALLARFPHCAAIFKGLSGVALLVAGWFWGLGVLLGMLGLFILLRMPMEWRLAEVHRDLRRAAAAEGATSTDEEFWLRRIFRRLRAVQLPGMQAAVKFGESVRLLRILRHPPARFGTMALALVGWTSPIWLLALAVPSLKWFGELSLRRVEAEVRAGGLPRPDQAADRAATLRKTVPADQDAGPIYESVAKEMRAASAKGSSAATSKPPPASPPPDPNDIDTLEDELEYDLDAAGNLPPAQRTALWQRMKDASARSHWLPSTSPDPKSGERADQKATGMVVAQVVGQELATALVEGNAERARDALTIGRRMLDQASASRQGYGGAVGAHFIDYLLRILERGLLKWGVSTRPPTTGQLALIAGALPDGDWLERQVVPEYLESLPQMEALYFAPRKERRAASIRAPWYSWPLAYLAANRPTEPYHHAAMLRHAARIQSETRTGVDPWLRKQDPASEVGWTGDFGGDSWRSFRNIWARACGRLDLAQMGLAWHYMRANGNAVNSASEIKAPWFPDNPPNPVSGQTPRLETNRGVRLVLPWGVPAPSGRGSIEHSWRGPQQVWQLTPKK